MWKRLIFWIFSCFFGSLPWCERSVVPLGHADHRVGAVAPLVGEHERGDPRHVGLEGQDHQVAHQADVLLVVGGDAGRLLVVGAVEVDRLAGVGDAVSSSRTEVRYSSSLRRSVVPSLAWSRPASSATKSRMLCL